jgi:hypothetical protein
VCYIRSMSFELVSCLARPARALALGLLLRLAR